MADRFRRVHRPGCGWLLVRADAVASRLGPDAAYFERDTRLDLAVWLLASAVRRLPAPGDPTLERARAHAVEAMRAGAAGFEPSRVLAVAELLRGDVAAGLAAVRTAARAEPSRAERLRVETCALLVDLDFLDEAAGLLAPTPSAQEDAHEHRLAAAAFDRAAGRPEDAVRRLTGYRGPWSAAVAHEHALARWDMGDRDAATDGFADIARREPRSGVAACNHLLALARSGRMEEARLALATARPSVRADPELRRLLAPRPASESAALAGELAAVALGDLLNLLGHGRATGRLVLDSEEGGAFIDLRSGRLVAAGAPGLAGPSREEGPLIAALERLLEWESGRFRFEPTGPDGPEGEGIAAPVALLHACTSLDERRRLRA